MKSLLLRSTLLRRGLSDWRRSSGFRLCDYDHKKGARTLEVLNLLFDVDLRALDAFIAKPDYWDSRSSLRAKRDELLQRREDADAAFAAGNIDLAITTLLLVNAEAKLVGMRVAANPVMVTHREAQERGKAARAASAAKRKAETEKKFERFEAAKAVVISKCGRITKDGVAGELGMSVPTLEKLMREKNVEI